MGIDPEPQGYGVAQGQSAYTYVYLGRIHRILRYPAYTYVYLGRIHRILHYPAYTYVNLGRIEGASTNDKQKCSRAYKVLPDRHLKEEVLTGCGRAKISSLGGTYTVRAGTIGAHKVLCCGEVDAVDGEGE
eukprot:2178730-Pyramimonas_sp.AAC.1